MDQPGKGSLIRIWDPVVRIGHWIIVAGFFTAYLVEDEFLTLHVWAGYAVGAVVAFRLLWGFIGPTHAKFRDFAYSPAAIVRYLRDLPRRRSPRYLGHSPAGGAMIFALLVCLAGTTWSGLELYAVEEGAGPLAALRAPAGSPAADHPIAVDTLGSERPDDDSDSDSEHARAGRDGQHEFWEEVHEVFANLTLLLVSFHVAGVLFSGWVHRENLVKSMFTGMKRPN
ncbi:MAG: cytochrome b/b6 domain-containing protein [Gammaproteobacteria bacterium]|nr:cytochrome b/b6 domain-containing protein [Gammaproteobacteria bacterium]MDH4253925.1 cytochrome b/b6 domain-containing protein [Gammaproteobacteria bacterium]MDH5309350.1 cytochrome b/b6 domain-containing protein [Gammaproteobacteria bacterium]